MSHKIIKPEGIELIEYLNNGYAICNRCGAVMRQTEDPKTGCGVYICPSCGLKVDEEDSEYGSDEGVAWTEGYARCGARGYSASRMQGLRRTIPGLQNVMSAI